jgi:hypothetical protein
VHTDNNFTTEEKVKLTKIDMDTKEDKSKKEQAANERRKLDLIEREMKNAQLNAERSGGMEGLKYLAGIQSNAIQSRNRSLFKNDLMRVVGQGV